MTLRLLVAARSASKEGVQLSASLNPEEFDNCGTKLMEMDAVMTLLESAERGALIGFDEKQQLTAEITDGSSEGSQDEPKVNTVAPQYLKNSLLYVKPSKFQPPGIFNSLMPRGYKDSLQYYHGLDIRNCNALAETIFRVLVGRKVEELNLEDTRQFRYSLKNCLENKLKEAATLTTKKMIPMEFFFKPCREQLCRCDMRIPSCTTSAVFQRIVGTSFLYSHHRGFSSRAGPSIHQPMWTVPRRDICSLARSPNMRRGYKDSLDIRNCNALAGTIFRVLDGRKVEELNLENSRRFRYSLEYCLEEEAETLTALEEKGPKKQAEEKQWSTPGSSLHSLTTAVKSGVFYPLSKVLGHLDVKKISSLVFSAVKKGKAYIDASLIHC